MSNKIGIVMGGYLDENEKLMTRQELNCRITSIQKENIELQSQLEQKDKRIKELEDALREIDDFYVDDIAAEALGKTGGVNE